MKPIQPIAVGLMWKEGQLAVGRRSADQAFGGFDEFPGGKCEPGEDPAAAVVRECREETGLATVVLGVRQVVRHELESKWLELWFFDLRVDGSGRLTPPFAWWSVAQTLAGNFPPANASILESLRRNPGPIGTT